MTKKKLEECQGYLLPWKPVCCHDNKKAGIQQDKNKIKFFSDLHYYSTFLDDDDPDMEDVFLAPREGQLQI